MSPRLVWITGFLIGIASLSATHKSADFPPPDEEVDENTASPAKEIIEKLDQLEARLKHLLKRNNSARDIEKLKKYTFVTVADIKSDIATLFKNYSKMSQTRLSHPQTGAAVVKHGIPGYNIYKMCKHIIDTDVCQRTEEHQDQIDMKKLLRIADRLINVKTRYRIYSAIYDDMVAQQYENLFNLYNFAKLLDRHFIANRNTPEDVAKDAKSLLLTIGKTFKNTAARQLTAQILNDCPSTEIDIALWELTVITGAFPEFVEILKTVVNATYDSVGALMLLDRSIWGHTAYGACQTVHQIHGRIETDGHLYHTKIHFKLIELIATALNNSYATLDDLEPCLEVEAQLNPSAREIVYAHGGCLQNQLHKAFMFPVQDQVNESKVYVSNGKENVDYAMWEFVEDSFNEYWIRHRITREYLYPSWMPILATNARDNSFQVMASPNREKGNRFSFELIPENGGVRILDDEHHYLYVTQQVLDGDHKKHLAAVWRGQRKPLGSVWTVVQC